jgi:uncharacterized SAM-binding protein YcdF (DUF218 family)
MTRFRPFLAGTLFGLLCAALLIVLVIANLPQLVTVDHQPAAVDAIVVLGGDSDGSRLRKGLQLHADQMAPRLILVAGSRKSWESVAKKLGPDWELEEGEAIFLEGSTDTRTDAQLTLEYCRANDLPNILVVTSPYHSRRAQFVFNDILAGSGINATVISSGEYGSLLPPNGRRWWRDRPTLETVWLEFGKILYWELTPYWEFQRED